MRMRLNADHFSKKTKKTMYTSSLLFTQSIISQSVCNDVLEFEHVNTGGWNVSFHSSISTQIMLRNKGLFPLY